MVFKEGFDFSPRKNLAVDAIVLKGSIERPFVVRVVQLPDQNGSAQIQPGSEAPPGIDRELAILLERPKVETQQLRVGGEIGGRVRKVVFVVVGG